MNIICYQPTQTCKTIGELKKLIQSLPDNMEIKPSSNSKKSVVVRFEKHRDKDKKWLTISGSGIS